MGPATEAPGGGQIAARRVAAKNKWAPIVAVQRNKRLQARYRAAFAARRRGELDVQFPFGTYQLRVVGLVRVEPPPT